MILRNQNGVQKIVKDKLDSNRCIALIGCR